MPSWSRFTSIVTVRLRIGFSGVGRHSGPTSLSVTSSVFGSRKMRRSVAFLLRKGQRIYLSSSLRVDFLVTAKGYVSVWHPIQVRSGMPVYTAHVSVDF